MGEVKFVVCGCALWCAIGAFQASAQTPVRDHDITVDDYFTLAVLGDGVISPDGKHVAYTDQRWEPPHEKRNTDLWVVDVETKRPRRLTFDKATDESPKWSGDSRLIYFTSNPKRGEEKDPPYNGK